jgi:hypothetical protein
MLAVAFLVALTAPPRAGQSDVDELLTVVLDRALNVPGYLPDRALLPKNGPLPIQRSVDGTAFVVTDRALKNPAGWVASLRGRVPGGSRFHRQGGAFRCRFCRRNHGDDGHLGLGIGVRVPDRDGGGYAVMCCCFGEDRYKRTAAGSWVFQRRDRTACW